MTESFDFAIIGLGAMGSASLHQLARRGANVVGFDRFSPPHDQGSTHGETRITRRAIGEGEAYVPLATRSHQLWRQIEAETSTALLHEIGSLVIGRSDDVAERPGRTGFVDRSIAAARRFGIDHEILDAAELRRRFPNFAPQDDEIGYYEPGGGYLRVEACVAAQLALAERHGADIRLGTQVLRIEPDGDGVNIITNAGTTRAGRVAVAAGPWAAGLLGQPFDRLLKPTRQVMNWFEIDPAMAPAWASSPVFMWPHGSEADGFFYGFPSLDGATAKVGDEFYGAASDPDAIVRSVPAEHSHRVHQTHLAGRLVGVRPHAARTATCIYTATADSRFVIDWHPSRLGILVVSPCSGHGFKHSAAIGEQVAALLIDNTSTLDLSAFSVAHQLSQETLS